ncbi:MAG TPA: alcohol dehydrogenase catalytic domain-containing protein, partial [Sphingomonas sp.]|uniref:alcohol dehydrogenase catalytic domain-containing protein n=1 Tax=Sphingomonas sp. TaxID=28214 RepID=UPI002B67A5AD
MIVPQPNSPFQLVEREMPVPGRHEVLVKVQACGVCHSDSVTVGALFPGIEYPRVPGHEVIGTIAGLGPDTDGWKVGERVGIGWFPGSCGYCLHCRRGEAYVCDNVHGATGVSRDGGYATHMIADTSALAHVPASLDSVEGAPLMCAGVTTFNAIRNAGAKAGELVAVQGIGGLGHLGIQFAAKLGFRTVAVNRGRDKEALARQLGALDYIDSEADDPAKALQAMGGAKAIIATVTNADAMQAIVGGLGAGGTMMLIGAAGPITINPVELLLKSAGVRGWYSGVAADSEDTLLFSELHKIASMNEIYPFAEAQAAYDRMMSGKARFRVVLKME